MKKENQLFYVVESVGGNFYLVKTSCVSDISGLEFTFRFNGFCLLDETRKKIVYKDNNILHILIASISKVSELTNLLIDAKIQDFFNNISNPEEDLK